QSHDFSERVPAVLFRANDWKDDAAPAGRSRGRLDYLPVVLSINAFSGLRLRARARTVCRHSCSNCRTLPDGPCRVPVPADSFCGAAGRSRFRASGKLVVMALDLDSGHSLLHRLNDGAAASELALQDAGNVRT